MSAQQVQATSLLRRGKVLRRVLRNDPDQEYYVYVPEEARRGAPLFVTVHGVSRNAREHATRFAPYCDKAGAVLVAPHFPAERFQHYQRLGRDGRSARSDQALGAIVEEVGLLTRAATERFYLCGCSGGAQFAHRYTMAHPQRVAGTAIVAAGWYTFPTPERKFPYGIRRSRELRGVRFDPEEFLNVPVAVFVGAEDTNPEGVRRRARIDEQQGVTRIERAWHWVEAMQKAAADYHVESRVSFGLLDGVGHSFSQLMKSGQLGDKVFRSLFGPAYAQDGARHNGKK